MATVAHVRRRQSHDECPATHCTVQTAECVEEVWAALPVKLTRLVADFCCDGSDGAGVAHLFGPHDEGPATNCTVRTAEFVAKAWAALPVKLTRLVTDYCCEGSSGGDAGVVHLFGPHDGGMVSLRLKYVKEWKARRLSGADGEFVPGRSNGLPSFLGDLPSTPSKPSTPSWYASRISVAGVPHDCGPLDDSDGSGDDSDDSDDNDCGGAPDYHDPLNAVAIGGDVYAVGDYDRVRADQNWVTRWDWAAPGWRVVTEAPMCAVWATAVMADRWLWVAGTRRSDAATLVRPGGDDSGSSEPALWTWVYDTHRAAWHEGPKLPPSVYTRTALGLTTAGNVWLWVSGSRLHVIWNDRFSREPKGARQWVWDDAQAWLAACERAGDEGVRAAAAVAAAAAGDDAKAWLAVCERAGGGGVQAAAAVAAAAAAVWTPLSLPERLRCKYGLSVYTGRAGRLQLDDGGGGETWVAPAAHTSPLPQAPSPSTSSTKTSGVVRRRQHPPGCRTAHVDAEADTNKRRRRSDGAAVGGDGAAVSGDGAAVGGEPGGGRVAPWIAEGGPSVASVVEWEPLARGLPAPAEATAVFHLPDLDETFYVCKARAATYLCVYRCTGGVPRWAEVAGSRLSQRFTNAVFVAATDVS